MAVAEIPSSIYAMLPQAKIASSAFWEEAERDTCFVLTHDEDGTNTLYCFILENSIWTERFHTTDAIPQGNNPVVIHLSEGAWDLKDSTSKDEQYYCDRFCLSCNMIRTALIETKQSFSTEDLDIGIDFL
jgi:hypothetical protein